MLLRNVLSQFFIVKCFSKSLLFRVSNKYPYFVGRLSVKLMTIQILCIIALVRPAVVWFLVGMYDNRTREIKRETGLLFL